MTIKTSIKRLLHYRMFLIRQKEMGFENVYSHYIAQEVNVSSEQVRKDFSLNGIKGHKKAGYNIDEALLVFHELFGRHEVRNVVIVGMGNMGRALAMNNKNFIKNDFLIVAGFDINPSKRKNVFDIPVLPLEELNFVVDKFKVKTAIITVSSISAQIVCNKLIESGVTGIMNFTPVVLKVPQYVIVNSVNLCNELEATSYSAMLNLKSIN